MFHKVQEIQYEMHCWVSSIILHPKDGNSLTETNKQHQEHHH